ncbi:hypothetical protein PybrP1_000564 [[Pythium] brassicae (nom. inval.)]|nr:hypothetical protein PybrP1_000564 [[Pythium] brassicae (nom. inval.)]
MFRSHKTLPAPAKSPSFRPGGKANDATSLNGAFASAGGASGGAASSPPPALGRVNPSHVLAGNKVWVSDARVLWRIGEVTAVNLEQQTAEVYVPDAPDEKLQTLALAKLYTFDASHIVDHEDVAAMNNMHEAPLLSVLRQRFESDKIYTFTADILLSINPYKTIPLLYDVLGFMEQSRAATEATKPPPHLFTIAEKAYRGMKGELPGKHASSGGGGGGGSSSSSQVHERIEDLGGALEQQLKLQRDVWNYTYLTHGDCVDVDGVDDAVEFDQLRSCLSQLGMDAAGFQTPMFAILAAVLHLGNVQFQSAKADTVALSPASGEEQTVVVFPESGRGVDLAHVSALLGVEPLEFAKKMVTQTTVTGRGSILELQLTPEQAKSAMDAFCKHLYGALFNHLIARINASRSGRAPPRALLTIYHGQHLERHAGYSKPRFECDEFVVRHYAGEVVYAIQGFIAKNTDNLHDDLLDLLRRSTQPLVATVFAATVDAKGPPMVPAKRGALAPVAPTKSKQALTGTSTLRDACAQIAAAWLEDVTGKAAFAMGRLEVFLRYGQVEKLEAFVAARRADKAVVLQAKLARGRIAYRHYQTVKRGVRRLQALWRMRATRARYARLRAASVLLQARFRGGRLRRRFLRLQRAASCVFRAALRFITRCRYAEWATRTRAAVVIQKHVRGFLSRTAAERARRLKDRSVLRLQSWYRMAARRRAFKRQRRAAVAIQSAYRSVTARRAFLARKQASIVLAAFVRQVLQRTKFRSLKARVVKLQALVRKWKHRGQFLRLRRLVVRLQSRRRQRLAAACAARRRLAVLTLQHTMRGWRCRCAFVAAVRSVRVLQYWATSWLLRREFRRCKAAAKRVQSAWRHHRRLKSWAAEMEGSDRRIRKLRQQPALFFPLRPRAFGFNSLFHHAAATGDFHVAKYMLDHQAQAPESALARDALFFLRNGAGRTAFHEACRHGQYEMAKFLLVQARGLQVPEPATRPVGGGERSNQSPDATHAQPAEPPAKRLEHETPEGNALSPPSTDAAAVVVVYSGFLRKRRETSRWMKRFVVLRVGAGPARAPQLDYYANDKPATLESASAKRIDLRAAVVKKSVDTPFAFEIHSPQLLAGRNREGRLYFAATSELESQKWLAHLRDSIPSTVESRVFAMHRGAKGGALEFVDFAQRKRLCNLPSLAGHRETPLHLAARATATATSTKLEMDADIVRTALWLVECGADINAPTAATHETPLKLALRAGNLLVAKHLLDRGALATGLSPTELQDAQRLKAALAKNAISSVGCSSAAGGGGGGASAVSRLHSFTSRALGGGAATVDASLSSTAHDAPVLFLLKQPGRVRHSSYVSVFVEHIGISNPQFLSRPRVLVSVLDPQRHLVEMKQQVSVQPVVLPAALLWAITWHMQTPLENLPHGACVVFELTVSPAVSAAAPLATPASAAEDFVPVCWTYVQVDQRTANCAPLNAEMYKYPLDLSLKKLQRVDAFINGDVFVSQGPQ